MIFGYDIRGIFGKDLNKESVIKIGNALSKIFKENTYGIARDTRVHSKDMEEWLKKGLGETIVNLGIVPLPVLVYFSILRNINSIMITASHNPPEYNGIKPIWKGGKYFEKEDIERLKKLIENMKGEEKEYEEFKINFYNVYFDTLTSKFKKIDVAVAFDPGNGAGYVHKKLLQEIFPRVVAINDYPDGRFPSHLPDPSKPENMKALLETCTKENIKIGIALDGDGDRVGIIYKNKILRPEDIISILALFNRRKKKIVVDVMFSTFVKKWLEDEGIKVIVSRTGRIFLRPIAIKERAILFGEKSGHIGLRSFYYIDDGIYSGILFSKIVSEEEIDDILKDIPRPIEERFSFKVQNKDKIMDEIKKRVEEKGYEYRTIDGIEIEEEKYRILIRKSNTEPKIKVLVEALDKESFEKAKRIAKLIYDPLLQ